MTGKEQADKFIDDMLNCSYEKKRPIRVEEWAAQLGEYFQSAILAEREECAKIAQGVEDAALKALKALPPEPNTPLIPKAKEQGFGLAATLIQHRIRARSQSAPQSSNQPAESPKISFAGHQPD